MKDKQISRILTCLMLILAMIITSMIPIFAESELTLYVLSDECPEEYYHYVEKEFKKVLTVLDPTRADEYYSVGTPFNWGEKGDVFYFPILKDGVLYRLLRVYPEPGGGVSGILSEYLVAEINEFNNKTSKEKPLFINCESDEIVAYLGTSDRAVLALLPDSLKGKGNPSTELNLSSKKIINIYTESFSTDKRITGKEIADAKNIEVNKIYSVPSSKSLSVSITETQLSGYNWCAAYVAALIVRYKTSTPVTAYNVMNYHYTNPQPTNSLGMYGIAEYGYSWGLDPVVYHGTLAQGTLVGQIVDDMPVYLGMNNISSSDSHAIALVGYSSYGDNMIIWNPWYGVTETYAFGSSYTPYYNSSYHFIYSATIFNWQYDSKSMLGIKDCNHQK